LFFTLGVSTATGVMFGLAPIMHTRLKGLVTALKEGVSTARTGAGHHHIRRGLVIAEVALAVMLVIGGGLLLRTVYNLTNVDAGFDRVRLVTFLMTLPQAAYPQAAIRAQKYQQLLDTLRAVPGVQTATAMLGLPPNRGANNNLMDVENYTAPPGGPFEVVDYEQFVMSDYFETMGIPVVQGRGFEPADASSFRLVVNETFVNTFLQRQNPIGQRVKPCCGDQMRWFTVVGVAKDVKQGGVDQPTGTELYFFAEQTTAFPPPRVSLTPPTMNVVLRTALSPPALARTIERVVREVDPRVPVVRLRDMEEVFAESIQRPRLLAQLLAVFAGVALLLAAIGIYGVLSWMVLERRSDIGIRMALGADRSSVVAQVMTQGLVLTTTGIIAGLAGAFALNRLIASLLFGVRPTDAATVAAVIATITLVAAVACWLPAWRASRLDPNLVLRAE